jgi:hypothetical protein
MTTRLINTLFFVLNVDFRTLRLEMKITLSLLLAFQLLASSMSTTGGLRVLFEVGAFLQHFVHHTGGHHETVGLKAFVDLHYSNDHHHNEDHGEHEGLPFHHHHQSDQTPNTPLLFPAPTVDLLIATARVDFTFNPLVCSERQWHSSAHLADIWEPPRS